MTLTKLLKNIFPPVISLSLYLAGTYLMTRSYPEYTSISDILLAIAGALIVIFTIRQMISWSRRIAVPGYRLIVIPFSLFGSFIFSWTAIFRVLDIENSGFSYIILVCHVFSLVFLSCFISSSIVLKVGHFLMTRKTKKSHVKEKEEGFSRIFILTSAITALMLLSSLLYVSFLQKPPLPKWTEDISMAWLYITVFSWAVAEKKNGSVLSNLLRKLRANTQQ